MTAAARTLITAAAMAAMSVAAHAADAARGLQLFSSERCAQCHSIHGKGGAAASDLAARAGKDFTPFQFASHMWNHAPTMWDAMAERNVPRTSLGERDAADLFAYLYTERFADKPADAKRGQKAFRAKHCADCHGVTHAQPGFNATPIVEWPPLRDPVTLMENMWTHAAAMQTALHTRKMAWPTLTSQELADIAAFAKTAPAVSFAGGAIPAADSESGAELYRAKGCAACHQGRQSPRQKTFRNTTAVAAAMWNHQPQMTTAKPMAPGEMRGIVSYVWEQQFVSDAGSGARGAGIFSSKGCARCHNSSASGALPLTPGDRQYSAFALIAALTKDGPQMLRQMKAIETAWPALTARDMADLAAYLSSHP
ncbi:MAG: c-type cytochrome [Bryobacteraceae bacterium]